MRRRVRIGIAVVVILGLVVTPAVGSWLNDTVETNGDVTISASNGPAITFSGTTANLTQPFPDTNTVDLSTADGNVTFKSSGPTEAKVVQYEGTVTELDGVNVSQNALTVNPDDKEKVTIAGGLRNFSYRTVTVDDSTPDFTYNGTSGVAQVTVYTLDAETTYRAVDANSGQTLAVAVSNQSGVATFGGMPFSEHDVLIQSGSSSPDLSNPRPNGNVSQQPTEFAADLEDGDLPGENVTVTWRYDGNVIDTTTVNQSGDVSTTAVPTINSGVHDWSARAVDEAGNADVVNATVGTPGNLTIRNVSSPDDLISSPVNVTVSFINGTTVETRKTSNGKIDMTGLPTTDFIVEVNASQDYYGRTVYISSIVNNQAVYLLDKNQSVVESRFVLEDATGQFDSESIMVLKRPINRSGITTYQRVVADEFGAEGVTATLERDVRYRISVKNRDGTVQDVGPYRASVSEQVTVQPGNPEVEIGSFEDYWTTATEVRNTTLEYRYVDPTQSTQRVKLYIHEKGNTSNRLVPNQTFYDLGNVSGTYQLDENESGTTWKVNYLITFDDGSDVIQTDEVSARPTLVPNLSDEWRLIAAVLMLLISAGIFSALNAGVGGVMVAVEGSVLWWTGWLSGATVGPAVVIALFVGVIAHLMTR